MLTTTPLLQAARRLRAEADDVELAVGRDLGDDRDDLRRADVEADDQVLAVLHHPSTVPSLVLVVVIAAPASCARLLAESRHARREAVAVAQVDAVDARARARERADRAPVGRDEAREALAPARRARARSSSGPAGSGRARAASRRAATARTSCTASASGASAPHHAR